MQNTSSTALEENPRMTFDMKGSFHNRNVVLPEQ